MMRLYFMQIHLTVDRFSISLDAEFTALCSTLNLIGWEILVGSRYCFSIYGSRLPPPFDETGRWTIFHIV
jgi:hypothetical protein